VDKEAHRAYMRTYMQKRRAELKKNKAIGKARLKIKSKQIEVDSDASLPPTIVDQNPVDSEVVKPVKKHRTRLEVKSNQTEPSPAPVKMVTPLWKKDQAEGSKRKHSV